MPAGAPHKFGDVIKSTSTAPKHVWSHARTAGSTSLQEPVPSPILLANVPASVFPGTLLGQAGTQSVDEPSPTADRRRQYRFSSEKMIGLSDSSPFPVSRLVNW